MKKISERTLRKRFCKALDDLSGDNEPLIEEISGALQGAAHDVRRRHMTLIANVKDQGE